MKTLNKIILLTSILIGVFSCKKEGFTTNREREANSTQSNTQKNSLHSFSEEDYYQNGNNPYDFFGEMHNDVMSYIGIGFANMESPVTYTNDSLFSFCHNYLIMNEIYSISTSTINDEITSLTGSGVFDDSTSMIGAIEKSTILGEKAQAYAKAILRITLDGPDTLEEKVAAKISDIKNIEMAVIDDVSLSSTELSTVLGSAAIARYSAYYTLTYRGEWPHDGTSTCTSIPFGGGGAIASFDCLAFIIASGFTDNSYWRVAWASTISALLLIGFVIQVY